MASFSIISKSLNKKRTNTGSIIIIEHSQIALIKSVILEVLIIPMIVKKHLNML